MTGAEAAREWAIRTSELRKEHPTWTIERARTAALDALPASVQRALLDADRPRENGDITKRADRELASVIKRHLDAGMSPTEACQAAEREQPGLCERWVYEDR